MEAKNSGTLKLMILEVISFILEVASFHSDNTRIIPLSFILRGSYSFHCVTHINRDYNNYSDTTLELAVTGLSHLTLFTEFMSIKEVCKMLLTISK